MNTITIELCAEDRARLDAILAAMQNCCTPFPALNQVCTRSAIEEAPKEEPKVEAPKEEPKVEAPKEEPKVEAPKEEPTIDRADIQRKVVSLSAAGKKDEVRGIVLAYNNTKVSDIPDDKLVEVWEKLNDLEA